MTTQLSELVRLDQSTLTLAAGERDVRDMSVIDVDGEEIGTVHALYVDPRERKVRFLYVRGGGVAGIGDSEYLVPVDAVDSIGERVRLGHHRDRVEEAPRYDPALVNDLDYIEGLYGWYGFTPFWGGWTSTTPGRKPAPRADV